MTKITRTFDFLDYQLKNKPIKNALTTKYNGKWVSTSTQEFIKKANQISRGLLRLGIKPNSKIAVISSSNRTEWNILDMGILQIGAQNVPIYPTISSDDYLYIFNHSEVTHCFLSDITLYEKANSIKSQVKSLKEIYSFEDIKGCKNWDEVLKLGEDDSNQKEVEKLKKEVKTTDLATIIYTSGTTGRPKGVMLSHKNIVSNVIASIKRLPEFDKNSKVLSFLPVCHVFERMLLYLYIYNSSSIYFAESIEKLKDNLTEVKPVFMSVVPRLLEKIYDGIIAKGSELKGIKKILFFWAVKMGLKYKPYEENGWFYEKKLSLAQKLIFSKWKAALGGNLQTMVSGSAALQPRLTRIFTAAGMPVMEGYGLTETSPVVTVNQYENHYFRIGSVGKAIAHVEIKIATDGEILVKGPNVMMGYYKDPKKTAEVMTGEYFHTGDKGRIDKDGFLKITGRKKEIFKTSGGKYISPVLLENELKQSPFIEQLVVLGEGQKMATAIIQLNFDFVKDWSSQEGIIWGNTNEELISNTEIIAKIQEEINEKNKKFGKWETIKLFELTPEVWSVENNLLTPTFKTKRNEIHKKYAHLYDKLYKN
ncbi:MAG: long-chain fatty acid--CoA ligase [Flavobacteriaceae bacterium]|nr:long-chain fatty acid--CoA ligase [Flavobacteriaceae bacterium]